MVLSPWGGTHSGDVEQSLCRNDGNALISPVSVIEAPLPAPKPGLISLLEGGEDPWIPGVRSPQSLCRNDGNALISPVSVIEAPLPAPKPGLISLLEGGEDPWIPGVRSPEAVPGDLSPGELLEGGKEEAGAGRVLSVCVLF